MDLELWICKGLWMHGNPTRPSTDTVKKSSYLSIDTIDDTSLVFLHIPQLQSIIIKWGTKYLTIHPLSPDAPTYIHVRYVNPSSSQAYSCGFTSETLLLVKSYLSVRIWPFRSNNSISSPSNSVNGIPQGFILGLLLFITHTAQFVKFM